MIRTFTELADMFHVYRQAQFCTNICPLLKINIEEKYRRVLLFQIMQVVHKNILVTL